MPTKQEKAYTRPVDESEMMANQLERLMGDPIADSVQGFVRVVSASEARRSRMAGACVLT